MKISVIGYSGCGKSTLSAELAGKYNAPIMYLDCVHWLSGWREQEREIKESAVEGFLDGNASWVIDGTYGRLHFDRRMDESDRIIILRLGRIPCLIRVLKRYFAYRGKSRESMTDGCDEKIDFNFLKWVVFDGRKKKRRKLFDGVAKKYADKVTVIKTARGLDRFYKESGLKYRRES